MVSTDPFTLGVFQIFLHGPVVKFTLLIRLPNNRNFFFSHSLMLKLSIAILLYPFSEPRWLMSADIDTTGKPLQSNSTAQTLTFNHSVNLEKKCVHISDSLMPLVLLLCPRLAQLFFLYLTRMSSLTKVILLCMIFKLCLGFQLSGEAECTSQVCLHYKYTKSFNE